MRDNDRCHLLCANVQLIEYGLNGLGMPKRFGERNLGSVFQPVMKASRYAGLCLSLGLIASCGGGDGRRDDALLGAVTVASPVAAATPFIARLVIGVERADLVRTVAYTIAARPGTVAREVAVTYRLDYLQRRGWIDAAAHRLTLPVFGLYADYANRVTLRITFADGSAHTGVASISTPAFREATPRYTALDAKLPRRPDVALGYDFLVLKNNVTTPVVLDTDGNLRWAGDGVTGAVSSTFAGGRFLAGSGTAPTLYRIELDGTVSRVTLSDPTYANFHHDLTAGKAGLLAEVDTVVDGMRHPGTVLAEIDAEGRVLKAWDMSAIFRAAMAAGGDDPSGLVRDAADWFHMNSAIYSPADDTLIVSSRENFVVKLDYDTGRIRWLLGDPGKYWYVRYPSLRALALTLTAGKAPVGQHALSLEPDGTLLLFNNGTASFDQPPGAPAGGNPGFSAVSRYAIDEAARTAAEVWTYERGRTIWADVCSSAYRASGGGYLIDYASAYGRTRAKLVGLDDDGNVAFDYELPTAACDTAFNAVPIDFAALVLE